MCKTDILFLGGAPYANIMAPELREYADNLDPAMASKVVLFTTSNWSKNIGNCEIYKVDCTDGVYGTPESIYKIKKLF